MRFHNVYQEEAPSSDAPPAAGGSTAPSSAGSDVDWLAESDLSTIGGATPEPTEPSAPPTEPAGTPVVPTTPAAPATPTPAPSASPTPVATPPVAPAAPVPPVAAPAATDTPAPPAATPESAPAPVDMAAARTNEITRLTGLYALNAEDAANIVAQPEAVVPKMLANLHVNVCDAVISAIFARLPETVNMVLDRGRTEREAQDEFYTAFPQLKGQDKIPTVTNAIRMYRGLNPKASKAETIRMAGINALIHLRLPIPPELLNHPEPAPAAPAPSFQPAAPAAGGSAPVVPQQSNNAFTLLNEELDQDERR